MAAPGKIVTFYSYKGGTGRSMALANFAWILATSGKRVLAIDWDLEAPGLHRYFRPFLIDPDLTETDGLIDVFWRSAASAMGQVDSGSPERQMQAEYEEEDSFGEALENAAVRLEHDFPSGGSIDFLAAGRQSSTYSQRANTFVWWRFYDIGGSRLLQEARRHLASQYDWILIDSRTGVSDTAGISTIQLPDIVVACFTLNRQSIEGVASILKSIRSFRSNSVDGAAKQFFPLATRIENAEQHRLEMARVYARSKMAEFLPPGDSSREYWDAMEVAYRPSYAFEEVLAAYGDATGAAGAADTMLTQMESLAQRIAGVATLRMPEIIDQDRKAVLAKYALGTVAPQSLGSKQPDTVQPPASGVHVGDAQPPAPVQEDSNDFLRTVLAKEQVWRSLNFNWRHLLSQRELDMLTESDRKGFGRTVSYYVLQSERAVTFFSAMNKYFLLNILFGILVGLSYYGIQYLSLNNELVTSVGPASAASSPGFASSPSLSIGSPSSGSALRQSSYWQQQVKMMAVWIGITAWVIAAILVGALQRSSKDAPYGLRAIEAFSLSFLGPFRPPIQDYVRPKHS